MNGLTSFQEYKRLISERLRLGPAQSLLDIGCGLGYDVIEAGRVVGAEGSAIGIDTSEALVAAARSAIPSSMAQVAFETADGEALPFIDCTVDAVRVDRTLQHVPNPSRVITEMYRVLRSGGRVACAEPDWGTFTITSEDREMERLVVNAWCDSFRHGWIGRNLKSEMEAVGFEDVHVTGHLLIAEGYASIDKLFDIAHTVANLRSQGKGETRLDEWLACLQDSGRQSRPIGTVTLFLATGTK
jgi:SAM-dependent methyltransferase